MNQSVFALGHNSYSIHYQGQHIDESGWHHFAWIVVLNKEVFHYKTGLGHALKKQYYLSGQVKNTKKEDVQYVSDGEYFVEVPKLDSVLHCLFLDADCGAMSFSEFCDNMGYSNDSLRALDIYRACEKSGYQLRKALGKDYYIEKQRIDALEL